MAKRFFVVECDSEFNSVYVYAVNKDYKHGTVNYHHNATDASVVSGPLGPKFYGQLNSILVTSETIRNAEPITPDPPTPTATQPKEN